MSIFELISIVETFAGAIVIVFIVAIVGWYVLVRKTRKPTDTNR